jgi:ATP synthase subunit 6
MAFLYLESGSLKGFTYSGNAGLWTLITCYFEFIKRLCVSVLGEYQGSRYYPFFSSLFFFVFILNFIGLMPYSFSITSQLSCTFSLSFSLLIGIVFLTFSIHGKRSFAIFLPVDTPFPLVPVIVPIEVLSYLVRFISLPVRLFANMMAGHILIKVFIGLSSSLLAVGGLFGFLTSFVPLIVLLFLLILELGVAVVQSYIFCLLLLIFLSDVHGSR